MTDRLTPAERSANMARIRGRNTKPELTVRRLLFGMGYRYHLHPADLPGRPDIVFRKRRAVIFIHGCFWHSHSCSAGRIPKTRTEFWESKLLGNKQRDARQQDELGALGWKVLVVWECETRDPTGLTEKLRTFLGPPSLTVGKSAAG
ncbi:DNA mismatch endonuclease Vsr (plasmid) [Azospirillum argentinense]|uniref:Very short patch repair endonuclease n=1 Tax=Azospirillum argentinense TaxID=2970906 RepID=A0A4D8PQ51_9PROT|nr:very short patch repair endonuclease [Azospirillum argentinense]QCN97059.1 DNA mismatch endonuclease Vsr [Azospirillum argentinense]